MADQPSAQPLNQPDQGAIDSNALAFGQGGGSEGMGFGDSMIGDFFGGGSYIAGPSWGGVTFIQPVSAGDRRFKLTENTSPFPTDRVFANYNLFDNALIDANGNELDLNRYIFGLERTFLQGNASLELRVPILNGVNSEQVQVVGGPPNRNTEFGNMSLTTKFLLERRNGWASSSGMGVILPTAEEALLVSPSGLEVEIANEAFHLQPFFAVQRNPNQYSWINFFTQIDIAAQGNTVTVTDQSGSLLSQPEIYNDQHLLFLDLAMGRWLYKSNSQYNLVNGIAGIVELHYTTTLNDTDVVTAGLQDSDTGEPLDTLTDPANRRDVVNATLGVRFLLNNRSSLTVAGVAPLRDDFDHLFDSEFLVQFSRYR